MNKKTLSTSLTFIIFSSIALTAYAEQLPPTLGDLGVTASGVTATSATTGTSTDNGTSSSTGTGTSTSTSATGTPSSTRAFEDFKDVPVNAPNYNAIIVLRYQGVLNGYSDNTFRPTQSLNRVEALKLIFEAAQVDLQAGVAPANFADTETTAWYSGYLNRALFLEAVSGYSDGTFKPERPVNLVEFLKMLEIAHKVDLTNVNLNQLAYADIMPGQWYTKYVNYAKINNLLSPDKDNKIFPDQPVTRAAAAEIIYRFRNLLSRPQASTSASGSVYGPTPLLSTDALYVSVGYHFAVQYPKLWFYATITNLSTADIRTYGFGAKDPTANPPLVTLELLPDNKDFAPNLVYKTYNYLREEKDGVVSLSTKIDGSSRIYKFSGSTEQENNMLTMLTSLTANITGLQSFNPAVASTSTTTTTGTTATGN